MKILVFDTETTGLPPRKKSNSNLSDWPHIVQLSYILYNTDNNSYVVRNRIIDTRDKFVIPKESSNIHGITEEISKEKGIFIEDAVIEFSGFIDVSDVIVAHNLSFDRNIIVKELERLNYPNYFNIRENKYYDTMIESIELCKIPLERPWKNQKYKYPKLVELYSLLFSDEEAKIMDFAHNAIIDVIMTLRCYMKMTNQEHTIDFNEMYKKYI